MNKQYLKLWWSWRLGVEEVAWFIVPIIYGLLGEKKIKQIKLVNFEKQVLSKTWTLKKVIHSSFVKEDFVVTYHQILYRDSVNIKFWKQTRSPKPEPSTTNGVFLLMIYVMKQIQLLLNYLFQKNRSFYEGKKIPLKHCPQYGQPGHGPLHY